MAEATIGDGVQPVYRCTWDHGSRTTEELGDLQEAGFTATLDDVVDVARGDPECEVEILGFEKK